VTTIGLRAELRQCEREESSLLRAAAAAAAAAAVGKEAFDDNGEFVILIFNFIPAVLMGCGVIIFRRANSAIERI